MPDTALPRGEHEEFRRTVEAKFANIDAENKRQNERLRILEETTTQIAEMNVTLQKQSDNISKLSDNISQLAENQKAEGERLKELEGKDGEMWRTVVKYAITVIVGALVGYALTTFGL